MRTFNVVIERDPDTGLFVGHVPGWPGAHSQGESLDELQANLQEVVRLLLEDGEPKFESEFVAVQTIKVAVLREEERHSLTVAQMWRLATIASTSAVPATSMRLLLRPSSRRPPCRSSLRPSQQALFPDMQWSPGRQLIEQRR